jgi:hypothetical protein
METVNRYMPIVNLTLSFLIIVLFVFYLLKDNKKDLLGDQNSKPVTVYVIYDTTGSNLSLKDVELLNLNPLTVKVIGNNLYIQKDGEWQKVEQGQVIYVYQDNKTIYGHRR